MKIKKGFSTASGGEFFIDAKAIDARANDDTKENAEKPLKVDMEMDELVKLFMQTPKPKSKKSKSN
jgi:hypothetical protein